MGTIIAWIFETTIGKYLVVAVAVALIGSLTWGGCERRAKLKARAERDASQMAAKIGYEAFIKLYEDREAIKAKAAKKRGKLNEWEKKGDLDSLRDDFNFPDGVRRAMPASGPSGSGGDQKASPRYTDPGAPGIEYQEAPGR